MPTSQARENTLVNTTQTAEGLAVGTRRACDHGLQGRFAAPGLIAWIYSDPPRLRRRRMCTM